MTSAFHVYFGPEALDARVRLRKIEPRRLHRGAEGRARRFSRDADPSRLRRDLLRLRGNRARRADVVPQRAPSRLPVRRRLRAARAFLRRRPLRNEPEARSGLSVSWRDAFAVFRSPALPSIIALGVGLFAIFAAWIGVADVLYGWLYGPKPPAAALPFLADVLTTGRGWTLIVVGSFDRFLLRRAGALPQRRLVSAAARPRRRRRSRRRRLAAARRATIPRAVALWGLIVAAALVLGSLPLFIGLAVVMPVLGHATWRLYRRAIERDPAHEVPIEEPTAVGLREAPVFRFLWVFLDMLQFLRQRPEFVRRRELGSIDPDASEDGK